MGKCSFLPHGMVESQLGKPPMTQSRFGLQTKIIIIFTVAVISVVGVSTYIAMLLTQELVEDEVFSKTLA